MEVSISLISNAFFACFFKFCLRSRKFDQKRVFLVICESSENHFGRTKTKKWSTKFSELFENTPLLEKILDPHLFLIISPLVLSNNFPCTQ